MAVIRDSVIDQYGNALANVRVDVFDNATGALFGTVYTDINGYFEVGVNPGVYRLQITGANITTRLINAITALDVYPLVSYTVNGLMAASDKVKLDNYPEGGVTISGANDFTIDGSLAAGDFILWNGGVWVNLKPTMAAWPMKADFYTNGGTVDKAGKYIKLDSAGRIDYSFLNVTPVGGQSQFQGRLPVLDTTGRLDVSMFNASNVGGPGYQNFLVKLNSSGLIDMSQLNTATVGGASSAGKLPKLNSSGKVDPSMLPTTGGVFRGSIDLTVAYAAPGWADGDYGSCSAAGTVHSTWNEHLNEPIPTTVKVGDNVYYTGGKFSVVPSATDLSAYLPRDGSQPMTGQLSLIDQAAALPTGAQAISRVAGDLLYTPMHIGAIPSVTQITSKNTAVSLNAIEGRIVTHNSELKPAAMAGPRPAVFTLSNDKIKPGSVVLIEHYASGTPGAYRAWAGLPVAGACTIYLENITGAALSQAVTLQFQVIPGGG